MTNQTRQDGYYWVRPLSSTEWIPAYCHGGDCYNSFTSTFDEFTSKELEIDETPITRKQSKVTHAVQSGVQYMNSMPPLDGDSYNEYAAECFDNIVEAYNEQV